VMGRGPTMVLIPLTVGDRVIVRSTHSDSPLE